MDNNDVIFQWRTLLIQHICSGINLNTGIRDFNFDPGRDKTGDCRGCRLRDELLIRLTSYEND
jgi:hypothetical protein